MRVRWCHVLLVIILLALGALACELPGGAKPTVVINSPPSNYKVSEGQELAVDVTATGGGNIARVELRVDGAVVDEASNPTPQQVFNVQLVWVALGAGDHNLEVRAYNTEDQGGDAAGIIIEVEGEVAVATGTAEVGPFATASPGETPSPTATASVTSTATPTATSTATPTATSTATATATATTPPAPVLNFWADPNPVNQGQPFTLYWHEDYASAIYLSGPEVGTNVGVTGPDGSKAVCSGSVGCPGAGDHTYTLRGEGPGGTTEAPVVVHVVAPAGANWLFFGSPQYGGTSGDHAGWLCMHVRNTGTVAFESAEGHIINPVTHANYYGPAYSDSPWRSAVFMLGPDIARLEPGQEAWSCYKLAGYPAPGTPIQASLRFYTLNGKAGTQILRGWLFDLP